jgi:hypothetical protein
MLSRRRFLGLSALAGGVVTALMTAESPRAWLLAPFRELYHELLSPTLEDAPTGTLSVKALNVLLETTRALAGVPIQIAHYEDFFRWRAENLRGYKAIYEQFAAILDRRARRSGGCDFVKCNRQMQQKMLQELPQLRDANTKWHKVRVAVLERESLRFDQYIVHDILLIFLRTSAWTLLGYEGWPGTPRGLDRYTRAPSQAR